MNRRLTIVTNTLFALLAAFLFRCALVSQQHNNVPYTAMFAACSITLGLAIAYGSHLREELRNALRLVDAVQRPAHDFAVSREDAVQLAIAAASCCETSWATAGTQHDPATCTRKDQTT
jgi:hypothetical protein